MTFYKTSILLLLFTLIGVSSAFSQNKSVTDKIVAIVNDNIILKSDVDQEIAQYMQQAQQQNQNVDFSEDLWYSALESMIDNYAMLEIAKVDSVVISDNMVNRSMDQRIQQMVRQAGSERALEQAFGQSIVEIRADFREQFREQMVAQEVQRLEMSKVDITRPEVKEFFNSIPEDQLPTIPEQVGLSHIVITPPTLDDAQNEAFQRAQALRDSVTTYGKDFEEMARKYSSGPNAARGGLLPMMRLDDLVSSYSAAAAALEPGEISEVVKTEFGYHVIRLNRRSGDNIETNHILIEIDEESVDEEFAINKLEALRDSVLNGNARFRDLARRHSEDEETKAMGGRLMNYQTQDRLFTIDELEPALFRTVLLLENEGEISEPIPFTTSNRGTQAYRIVRLDQHVPEHVANLDDDYERIREIALQQKQMEHMEKWISNIRERVYVEYKINVPDNVSTPDDMMTPPTEEPPVGTE